MMRPDQDPLLVEQMHAAAYRSTRRSRNAHVGTLGMGLIRTFPLNSFKKYNFFCFSFLGLRIITLFIFIRIKALF